jgi:putative transposase
MKRKRDTEEQIIAILKEHEAGTKTAVLCRKHGTSFYNSKAKYGGLEVSEAKRLKGLEGENAKLKKLLADAMLNRRFDVGVAGYPRGVGRLAELSGM